MIENAKERHNGWVLLLIFGMCLNTLGITLIESAGRASYLLMAVGTSLLLWAVVYALRNRGSRA